MRRVGMEEKSWKHSAEYGIECIYGFRTKEAKREGIQEKPMKKNDHLSDHGI